MRPFRTLGTHHSQRFGLPEVVYDILYEGVEYRCDAIQLAHLYDGVPIEELDLQRLDDVADDD